MKSIYRTEEYAICSEKIAFRSEDSRISSINCSYKKIKSTFSSKLFTVSSFLKG